MPSPNIKEIEKEFLKLHYEPEHESGGVCWCGVTYFKIPEGMEIKHVAQRELLADFLTASLHKIRLETIEEVIGKVESVLTSFPERESDEYDAGCKDTKIVLLTELNNLKKE